MSERRIIKLAEEADELHRENAQLREALREARQALDGIAPIGTAAKILDAALGDTDHERCPICGLPTTAGPYQCGGHTPEDAKNWGDTEHE